MSNKTRDQYKAALLVIVNRVEAAGPQAFAPVLGADGKHAVSQLLLDARAALEGCPKDIEERAEIAFKRTIVDGGTYRLDLVDDQLQVEVNAFDRWAREDAKKAVKGAA